ncbi:hypothetical protein ACHWQZ_G010512 [Mnemiopsis leidyi]
MILTRRHMPRYVPGNMILTRRHMSRCPDCTVLKRTGPTTTVLDGVERTVTITERKLCPTHLDGDSTVPPPLTCAPDSPSPPPTLPFAWGPQSLLL